MENKEAIEFCELHRWIKPRSVERLEGFKKVEILLKQSEKYRQMWEEFKWKYGEQPMEEYIDIATQMNNLEQKYFPREVKQDYPESEE